MAWLRVTGALVALLLATSGVRAEEYCDHGVCIDVGDRDGFPVFEAENPLTVPILLTLTFEELENLRSSQGSPIRAPLAAGERRPLAELRPVDPERRFHHRFRWSFRIGSIEARHDAAARYRMPFGGTAPRRLMQGVGGSFSHRGRTRHAFDFELPVGTPILAARAGSVAWVVDGYTRGGPSRSLRGKANSVSVVHADGTLADYVHLRSGIVVREGERVDTGALLGYGGNTGFTTAPHLHFQVWKRSADGELDTVPILFEGGDGRGFVPEVDGYYPPGRIVE